MAETNEDVLWRRSKAGLAAGAAERQKQAEFMRSQARPG
jgi:glycerol-3-phosphate dehydrogenase